MAGQLLLSVVAAYVVVSLSAAQNCNETAKTQFVMDLGSLVCGLSFQTVNNTPNTLSGMMALDRICVQSCAGAVAGWLNSPVCNDTKEAAGLTFWCQPADNGNAPRCRFVLENTTLFTNQHIMQCGAIFTGICPGTCSQGLRGLSEEAGCCYQNIYNNTAALDGLRAAGTLTANERLFFDALSNPFLWDACMVSIPEACTSVPFPVEVLQTVTAAPTMSTTTDGAVTVCFNISLATTILLCLFALVF